MRTIHQVSKPRDKLTKCLTCGLKIKDPETIHWTWLECLKACKRELDKMMDLMYILDGHTPVPCDDVFLWAHWHHTADRRVAKTQLGDVEISTVFLGTNVSIGEETPLLFETMVFGGERDRFYSLRGDLGRCRE
jgi:hypothetical protein